MDELTIGDKVYISTKRAADITGYAKDYVGQLCREGRVEATLVGRSWYVLESSVREHRFGSEEKESPSFDERPPILDTWSVPVYKPEPIVEMPSLESKEVSPDTDSETIEDMQAAWKEWFTKRESSQAPVSQNSVSDEAVETETVEDLQEQEAQVEDLPVVSEEHETSHVFDPVPQTPEIEAPVTIHREYREEPRVEVHHVERVVRERRLGEEKLAATKRRGSRGRGGKSTLLLRAFLMAFTIVAVAVTLVGLGFADEYAFNQDARYELVRFFSGIETVEK